MKGEGGRVLVALLPSLSRSGRGSVQVGAGPGRLREESLGGRGAVPWVSERSACGGRDGVLREPLCLHGAAAAAGHEPGARLAVRIGAWVP